MQPRIAAAAAAAVVVAFAATGCNILTPQATQIEYDPSDGVSGTTGAVTAHNVMLIGDPEGDAMNLAVTFTNEGEATFMEVRYEDMVEQVRLPSGVTAFGFPGEQQIVVPVSDDLTFGSLQNVAFEADGAEAVGLRVPTISTDLNGYETFGPVTE
ncbi:hypothetical protein [Agrococcus sp. Ld7]|uniref:hypothetical protein n=1 Tax=Agrococcus sp. Ld7 TaxID=649148 RepID=UPI0038651FC3